MAGLRSRVRHTASLILDVLRVQLPSIVPVGVVVVVGILVLGIFSGAYAQLIGVTAYSAIVESVTSVESYSAAVALVLTPLVLLALLVSLVWAGTAIHAANAALDKRAASMPRAAWSSFRRAPRAAAIFAITLLAFVGAVAFAPLLVVIGLLGLLFTSRAARSRFAERWPSRGALIAMAIPFGVAVLVLVRWSLAVASVWLGGLGVRAALADSSSRVRGRGPEVGVVVLLSLVGSVLLSEGLVALAGLLQAGTYADFAARVVALILVGALPFMAVAVLYRRASAERPDRLPAPSARRMKVAAGLVVALVIPFVVSVVPGAAMAAVSPVTLVTDVQESIAGEEFLLTATVTGVAPSGTVAFQGVPASGPTVELGSSVVDGSGIINFFTDDLPSGTFNLVAHYSGDANNAAANSAPVVHTVHAATASIAVTSTVPLSGDTTTVTMTLSAVAPGTGTPTGSVIVSGGGYELGTITLAGGIANLPLDVAAVGSRSLTIVYSGDSRFASGSTGYSIPKIPTILTSDPTPRGGSYGTPQTFTGTVGTTTGTVPTGTVQLVWFSGVVATITLVSGAFSITTDELRTGSDYAYLMYLGDASHAASDNSATLKRIHLDVSKATSVPVLSIDPAEAGIGGTVTATATLDDLGVGPTGDVTFRTNPGNLFWGTYPVVNGKASFALDIDEPVTFLSAEYSGGTNFNPTTATTLRIDADRAAVDVAIEDPGTIEYGEVFYLTATVSVGGGSVTPDHGVDFSTTTGPVFASDVAVVGGTAKVQVCAGAAADCPLGIPLGAAAASIVARYSESSTNLLGESGPYAYSAGKAVTTTTLVVNPTTIIQGSAIFLTATVDAPSSGVTPTGYIVFSGSTPLAGGLRGEAFLGSVALDANGVAHLETSLGDGVDQLRWPADAITADYFADGARFERSVTSVPVTATRVGVTLDLYAPAPTSGATSSSIEVTLHHDPGASAGYTGKVIVTIDGTEACTVFMPQTDNKAICPASWATVGSHTVSASYSGDIIFLPGTSPTVTVAVGKRTPVLGLTASTPIYTQSDASVTWNQFDPAATGTVTVWGDGIEWCTVPVQTLGCTGQFGIGSATGSPVEIIARYTGDATWNALEQHIGAFVTRCAVLDVRSSDSALGTVRVDTAPNCGPSGYLPGTSVTIVATPIAPAALVGWLGYLSPNPNLIILTPASTTTFVVSNDTSNWVRVAKFQVPCHPVTANTTAGYGDIFAIPASNCTTDAGTPGWLHGTRIQVYPLPGFNPGYGEKDTFRSFGTLPAGAQVGRDSGGFTRATFTVNGATIIPLGFGPRCRPVNVVLDPAHEDDTVEFRTAQNCFSPDGDGFLRDTEVTAYALSGDPSLAISGWSLNGLPDPELGTTNEPKVKIGMVVPVLTATLVHCYTVEAVADGANVGGDPIGAVRIDGPPNCPDGSERYLAGTEVTLTPEVLVEGAAFNGWDDERTPNWTPSEGIGDVTLGIRKLVVDGDVRVTAGFYLESSCSTMLVLGDPGVLTFDNTGCGPGYYFDSQKESAGLLDKPQSSLWDTHYRTPLHATINRDQALDVYVAVRGDTSACFGGPQAGGPWTPTLDWQNFGPLRGGEATCPIGGAATFKVQTCQTVVTNGAFQVAGDVSGSRFDSGSLPNYFNLAGSDGVIGPFTLTGFDWATPVPVDIHLDGSVTQGGIKDGPCRAAGDAFPANADFALIAAGPSTGFTFAGWTELAPDGLQTPTLNRVAEVQGLLEQNPIVRRTTSTQNTLPGTANFTITCHTVNFGEGISIVGEAPRCPGSSEADNVFIAGTAIQVKADWLVGSRSVEKYTEGVVAGQITRGDDKALYAYAIVDGDKTVKAFYPTTLQALTSTIVKGLKITASIMAIAAPIILGAIFPPAGIFFAVIGAAAGIASLIPGGDKAAAVFDLINPTKIMTCVARWGFGNSGNPTGGTNGGSMLSTINTVRKIAQGVDVLNETVGPLGIAGGLASLGYGLYDAGAGGVDTKSIATVEEMADTETMTGCLDDQWRAAGSNLSGTPSGSERGN